jgi:SAM-dependent methyltransferase
MTNVSLLKAKPAACFLCHVVAPSITWQESPYEGRQCSCGLLYTSPTPPPGAIDITHEHHSEHFYSTSACLKARWMSRHCPGGRLLEVGCGNGAFLSAAQQEGYDVTGLDANADRCRYVREVFGIPVFETSLENNQLDRAQYDVVYHCDMLAHFPDPVGALHEMAALLRPGGVLCFEVGILGGISPVWYRLIGGIGLGHHLWLYSRVSLNRLFALADMEVVHSQRFGLAPYVLFNRMTSAPSAVRRRLSFRLDRQHKTSAKSEAYARWQHFFRYRIGAFSPAIGPQTVFFVLRPLALRG